MHLRCWKHGMVIWLVSWGVISSLAISVCLPDLQWIFFFSFFSLPYVYLWLCTWLLMPLLPSRFDLMAVCRYMRGEDGFMYLQLIRFESTTARGGGQHDGEGEFAVGTGEVEGQYASWQGAVDGESDYGDEYGDEMDGDDEDDGEYDLDDFQVGW